MLVTIILVILAIIFVLFMIYFFYFRNVVNVTTINQESTSGTNYYPTPSTNTTSAETYPTSTGTCPACPDCNCPECPDCECGITDNELKSAKTEIHYLKWMVRLLGALARRDNAVSRVIQQHCPGVYPMVPMVQEVNREYSYIQSHVGKDKGMTDYFQNFFTKFSGIQSKAYKEIL